MDNVKKKVYSALNYFHTDDDFNRVTFGLKRNALSARLVRWRFADLVLLGVLCVLYIVTYKIEPFQRQFFINDLTISHPFARNRKSDKWGIILLFGVGANNGYRRDRINHQDEAREQDIRDVRVDSWTLHLFLHH